MSVRVFHQRRPRVVGVVDAKQSIAEAATRERAATLCAQHSLDASVAEWDDATGEVRVPLPVDRHGALSVSMLRLALIQTDGHATIGYVPDDVDPTVQVPVLFVPSQEIRTSRTRIGVALVLLVIGACGLALAWYACGTSCVVDGASYSFNAASSTYTTATRAHATFMHSLFARAPPGAEL